MRIARGVCLATFTLVSVGARTAYGQTAEAPPPSVEPPAPPPPPKEEARPPKDAPAPPPPDERSEAKFPPRATGTVDDHSTVAADGYPLAGYHNGAFYLRDIHDNFRLYVQGRAQIDFYSYLGPGVSDTTLKPTLFLRRIRPELTGEFLHNHFQWMLAGDWGSTSVDNSKGTNETAAAGPGSTPSGTSAKFASAQTASIKAAPTDVFINARAAGGLNLQIGQFDAPFMMENRTSDKYIPFMERSLAVRDVGVPTNKEIGAMVWGETKEKLVFYSFGPFMGEGQNRPNLDGRFDFIARAFFHPLATVAEQPLKMLQIGGSFWGGSRDPKYINYDYPSMTTQGNYAFWSPTYGGSKGTTHVIPSGTQLRGAGELRIPVSLVDLTSEIVYIANDTREAIDGYQATNSERFGRMSGTSYYVQLAVWPIGNRDVNGLPGYENPTHLDFTKPDPDDPPIALQLLVKWEQLMLKYDSASRQGTADPKNIDGDIKANAFSVGANLWLTKHVRLTANYVLNMFPGALPVKPATAGDAAQTSDQRAIAPANTLAAGVNDAAHDTATVLHELLFRFAIAL